jgi:hypothetical protein
MWLESNCVLANKRSAGFITEDELVAARSELANKWNGEDNPIIKNTIIYEGFNSSVCDNAVRFLKNSDRPKLHSLDLLHFSLASKYHGKNLFFVTGDNLLITECFNKEIFFEDLKKCKCPNCGELFKTRSERSHDPKTHRVLSFTVYGETCKCGYNCGKCDVSKCKKYIKDFEHLVTDGSHPE